MKYSEKGTTKNSTNSPSLNLEHRREKSRTLRSSECGCIPISKEEKRIIQNKANSIYIGNEDVETRKLQNLWEGAKFGSLEKENSGASFPA